MSTKPRNAITKLTLLYDPSCALCCRCQQWFSEQETFVDIVFLANNSEEAKRRFSEIPWLCDELVVVADTGEVWAGAAAFIVTLWSLRAWRDWSYRLSGPMLAPLAERFFIQISKRRHWLGALVSQNGCGDGLCRTAHRLPGTRPLDSPRSPGQPYR
jgi:predicted DCC family thiol-disulfide oxidoreductase YuxK